MRVLWVTENHPPSRGGMAESCDRIVRGLRRAGVEIDVAHLRRSGPTRGPSAARPSAAGPSAAGPSVGHGPRVTRESGGRLITVPLLDDPEHALRLLWTTLAPHAGTYTHVVAFGGVFPLLAAPVYAAWAQAPLVTLVRGNDFDTGMFSLRRQPVVLSALRASARVCVVASGTAPLVSALAPGVPVTFVANGIELPDWDLLPSERARAAAWRAERVAPGRRVMGVVGQLKSKKGVGFLLDCLASSGHADRFHLALVGDVEESVLARLEAANVAHTTMPFLDRYELLPVYGACDLVALPSFYDGMPNVALEAAALGVPLLASDAGGLADLVDDRVGFRFTAGDPHGCRAALHRAATAGADELATLGAAAAALVRDRFDARVETEAYLKVLDRVAV